MATNIAAYYLEELVDWRSNILRYSREMEEFEKRLEEVIRRNSIAGIAEMVEAQQSLLNKVAVKFHSLQAVIRKQESGIKTDSILKDDSSIDTAVEQTQAVLRAKMQKAEKEYIDVKFGCYQFLSGTLKKK
jgi:predicted RND superfamily exporter protein